MLQKKKEMKFNLKEEGKLNLKQIYYITKEKKKK